MLLPVSRWHCALRGGEGAAKGGRTAFKQHQHEPFAFSCQAATAAAAQHFAAAAGRAGATADPVARHRATATGHSPSAGRLRGAGTTVQCSSCGYLPTR